MLQETNLIIWSKWRQFEPGTNFLAWSRAIARLEVFRFRRARSGKVVYLEEDLLDLVAKRAEVASEEVERRQEALAACVEQLRSRDRELIRMRYAPGANGDKVAHQLDRPPNSVYQSLGRIKRVLMECVRMRLAQETLVSEGGLS